MASVNYVLNELQSMAHPEQLTGMAKYGITIKPRLGASVPDLRKLAKEIGKDHYLSLDLWRTGTGEAKILAAMTDDPDKLTEEQMDDWVKDINSWDICD